MTFALYRHKQVERLAYAVQFTGGNRNEIEQFLALANLPSYGMQQFLDVKTHVLMWRSDGLEMSMQYRPPHCADWIVFVIHPALQPPFVLTNTYFNDEYQKEES